MLLDRLKISEFEYQTFVTSIVRFSSKSMFTVAVDYLQDLSKKGASPEDIFSKVQKQIHLDSGTMDFINSNPSLANDPVRKAAVMINMHFWENWSNLHAKYLEEVSSASGL